MDVRSALQFTAPPISQGPGQTQGIFVSWAYGHHFWNEPHKPEGVAISHVSYH